MHQPELIGTLLAQTDDETQAEILNEFVTVLGAICKPREFSNIGMQAYYIAKRLRPATVDFFEEMIGSYKHLHNALPAEVAHLQEERDRLYREVQELRREKEAQ